MPNSKNTLYISIIIILALGIFALLYFGIIPCLRQQKLSQAPSEKTWCYDFNTNLGYGDRGEDVKALQIILKEKGFFQEIIDGVFDDFTASAVVGFQQENLSILASLGGNYGTGYVDEITRQGLNEVYGCSEARPEIQWETYRNADFSYEISYPESLSEGGEYLPGEEGLHRMWRRDSNAISWETLSVYVKKSSYNSFEDLWTNLNKQAEEKFATVTREKCIESFEKTPNFEGSKIFYNYKAGCVAPPDTINSETIILKGDLSFQIFHSCAPGLNCRERFNQILATFKFFESEEGTEKKSTETPTDKLPEIETPAPTIQGSLSIQTSPDIPSGQSYSKGEIGAKLLKINFTAGLEEDVKVSQVNVEIDRGEDDASGFLQKGDLREI